MKNTTVIVLFLFIAHSLFSQTKDTPVFPTSNAIWTEQYGVYEFPPAETWTSLHKTENDTIINGRNYVNIYQYKLDQYSFDTIRKLNSSIRVDSVTNIAYIIRHYAKDKKESKLLDFNKEVGDTIHLYSYYDFHYTDSIYMVDSIKYIEYNNNKVLKTQFLSPYNEFYGHLVLVEGVGHLKYPFGPKDYKSNKNNEDLPEYGALELLCLSLNDTNYYYKYSEKDCNKLNIWTSTLYSEPESVIIYPNPTNGKFIIEVTTSFPPYKLQIFNLMGSEVYESSLISHKNICNIKDLLPGIYYVKCENNNNTIITSKLIIK